MKTISFTPKTDFMKNQSSPKAGDNAAVATSTTTLSVQQLISQLMNDLLPSAVDKRSFILNNVDPSLRICSDKDTLAFVIWNMLNSALRLTENDCIRVEAATRGRTAIIRVKNGNGSFCSTPSYDLDRVQEAVNKMKGSLSVDCRKEGTIMAFAFHCRKAA